MMTLLKTFPAGGRSRSWLTRSGTFWGSLGIDSSTVGLPAVQWWKLDVIKGNLPGWVSEEINRADKTEYRSRGELRVHNVEPVLVDAASEYEQIGIDLGMLPPGGYERRYTDALIGEKVEIEFSRHPGRIISVGGRPVRRD